MNPKERYYSGVARETIHRITANRENWTSFLATMARNYDFTYPEQVMIYAQRPNATLCKPYEEWNTEQYRRYVKRGSTGIALFVMNQDKPYLRYVFDVADTGVRRSSPSITPWRVTDENRRFVMDEMERVFQVPSEGILEYQLENIAINLAREYWDDFKKPILDIVADSFLEEYDEYNIEVAFKTAVANSVSYAMYSRITENPDNYFEHEDFQNVFDFNTRQRVNALGTAVNAVSSRMFGKIEKAIEAFEQTKTVERSHDYERNDLHTGRGLPDSGHRTEEHRNETVGQVRQNAEGVSAREQPDVAERLDSQRAAVPASPGDRRDSAPQSGAVDDRTAGEESGTGQSDAADGMGAAHEQPESTGRGNRDSGAYQQLSLNLFLSESEQISFIDEAESKALSAFSLSENQIDQVLTVGGNEANLRMMVALKYMEGKSTEEIAKRMPELYRGSNGFKLDGHEVSAWFDEQCIHLARGKTARFAPSRQIVSWQEAAERIGKLLENGEDATNVELVEAPGYERTKIAESFWYLYHDLSDNAREQGFFPSLQEVRSVGFPAETAELAQKLNDSQFRAGLKAEYQNFLQAHNEDSSLLRFHYHKLERLAQRLEELDLPLREYQSSMTMPPIVRQFITDDEINESLFGGSGFSGGKARIYEYWQEGHSVKEKADFLKNEYGTGGHSHALSGASGSGEDHDAKGIRYTKSGCDKVQLSWTQVANRIDSLIKQKRYFDKDTLEQYRQEQQVAEQSAPSEPEEWEQVDGTAIREALEHRSMEKSPFIQQVMRDAEAIAAGEESYERFSVIETENGYAVWDDIRDEIYVDDEGVSEEFTSEWQANDYLQEVKKAVSAKESAEWLYNERSKFEATQEPEYQVGDAVFLEGEPYNITRIGTFNVELLPPGMVYPIYRAESKENFERILRQDERNTRFASGAEPKNTVVVSEPEHFIDHYYVVEDLQVRGALQLKEYSTFEDAMRAYQSLPSERMKALGVQNTRTPFPGSLDLIQCKDGEDKLVQDYTKVAGWENPEILDLVQKIETAIQTKESPDIPAINFHITNDLLSEAVTRIGGTYAPAELTEEADRQEKEQITIPARPDVKNFSYTVVDGEVYFRENSVMRLVELNDKAKERVSGMVELRRIVNELIEYQLEDYPDDMIQSKQAELNAAYDAFTAKNGLINNRANSQAFADDSSYYLLCSLENLDEDGNLKSKADMFTKRTIKPERKVNSVDTPSEALAISIGEHGKVDLPYMAELLGTPGEYDSIKTELQGVVFKDPMAPDDPVSGWQTADEYLSGDVRSKLRIAQMAAQKDSSFEINVQALEKAQPKDLDASEIDVRLGATWIDPAYIQQFMQETFETPYYLRRTIEVKFSELTAEWRINGKSSPSQNDVAAYTTYGTERANAYRILEETLNLKDIRIYDTIEDADGKQKRVLNKKETTLAQQKQQAIKDAFRDWIWKDPHRREALVTKYNELFNSTRPREYDGSHIRFGGMNPDITLREHQRNAIAHVLYGGNTLLAHEVGAGKTFEMAASAMESKRLGLSQKALFVVPNHLTLQWANEFLHLYPSAKLLVATKKDFETANRKKFCARIATGDYDAVIIGHSQFEKIPLSPERQERQLREQIDEIEGAIAELKYQNGENFTIKQMEKTRKSLQTRLDKLLSTDRKDDVVTFEQLGVDRLFVDESHAFKNLFLYTKMRNVAGLSTSEAQKSSDMFMKCRYMDELTGGRGVIFATGTPVSNSMTELYTVMRYLQYGTLQKKNLTHFDCWASTFGETTTAIELAPEGCGSPVATVERDNAQQHRPSRQARPGYRARTRFAKFFNLPELMNMFKEVADIKTSDQLHLPVPDAKFETVVVQPSDYQKDMVADLSERAAVVHSGMVDPSEDNMLKITGDG